MTDKVKTKSRITLLEKNAKDNTTESSEEIISDDKKVAEIFHKFFVNIILNLKTSTSHNCDTDFQKADDPA